ncbi:MAG TPA: dicarboxylate transporter/tellurite-resistance protein TehA [Usitatibacteraceae bacterium]
MQTQPWISIAQRTPASMFGMVLGLAGIGSAWRVASVAWGLPAVVGELWMALAGLVWIVLTVLTIAKWIAAWPAAHDELMHPIQCCFIGLVPVSGMLVAIGLLPHAHDLAVAMMFLGLAGHLVFSLWRTGELWRGGRAPDTSTPVLYLPAVAGNFVSAIALGTLGHADWGIYFLGAGLLTWLAYESIIIQRLLTGSELPLPLRPTLGIQIAPGAVGAVAWLSVVPPQWAWVAQLMIGYAVLQMLVVLRLSRWIAQQPFGAGYWAFSFGVTALATAPLRLLTLPGAAAGESPLRLVAMTTFTLANILLAVLVLGTLWLLVRGRLLPPASPAPAAAKS